VLFVVVKIGNDAAVPASVGIPEIVKVTESTMLAIAKVLNAVGESVMPIARAEVFPDVSVTVVELVVQVAKYAKGKRFGVCDADARTMQ